MGRLLQTLMQRRQGSHETRLPLAVEGGHAYEPGVSDANLQRTAPTIGSMERSAGGKKQFVVIDDYGTGGIWGIIAAESAEAITRRYPQLRVITIGDPDWVTPEKYSEIVNEWVKPHETLRHRSAHRLACEVGRPTLRPERTKAPDRPSGLPVTMPAISPARRPQPALTANGGAAGGATIRTPIGLPPWSGLADSAGKKSSRASRGPRRKCRRCVKPARGLG